MPAIRSRPAHDRLTRPVLAAAALTAAALTAAALTALLVSDVQAQMGGTRLPDSKDTVVKAAVATDRKVKGAPVYRTEIVSELYEMDRVYKSMRGPRSRKKFLLDWNSEGGPRELLWMVGYEAFTVASDGDSDEGLEFTCHSNLDLNPAIYHERFPTRLEIKGSRLFTLAQGQRELDLPEGFGVPLMSRQTLALTTQVLNHNREDEKISVRQKVRVEFVRDSDLEKPLIPLIPQGIQAMVLVEGDDPYFGMTSEEADPDVVGPGCSIGEHAGEDYEFSRDAGGTFSGFWYVPPGRHEYHSLVTKSLGLPYDTTVHYIASHLHPFAESLELRDLTTGKTVFKSKTRQVGGKEIGLAQVQEFSSVEGLPLYKDHEYSMVAIYENTSGQRQDSMAVMILYVRAVDLYDFDFRPRERPKGSVQGG